MTIRAAVFAFMDRQTSPRRWSKGYLCACIDSQCKYNDKTIMRYCRDYAAISGASIKCIDRRYGYYDFTPGVKVGKAIVD